MRLPLGRRHQPPAEHIAPEFAPEFVELRSLDESEASNAVNIINDAASSINIDEDAVNEDGAELVNAARQIIDSSINWHSSRNDFDQYTVEVARRVLESAPRQRHLFDNGNSPRANIGRPSDKVVAGTLVGTVGGTFGGTVVGTAGGVSEDVAVGAAHTFTGAATTVAGASTSIAGIAAKPFDIPEAGPSVDKGILTDGLMRPVRSGTLFHNGFSDGFFDEAISDSDSIFTMNIDMDELPSSQTMRLSRSFRSSDFKWLCLMGGIPLGMFVGTSNCIGVSGPLGTIIGFLIVIPGVLSVLSSLSEMIAFYPMEGGFPLLVSAYVERSLGFAVGICYWVSCALLVPAEVLKALRLMSLYSEMDNDVRTEVVWLTFIIGFLFAFSCVTTRMASWSMRLASMVTAGCLSTMLVFMWVYDAGGVGNKVPYFCTVYWRHPFMKHHFTSHDGSLERAVQVWHAISVALESYSGVEIPFTAMPEIRNPRRTVKSGMRLITVRVVLIYLIVAFSFTLVTPPHALAYIERNTEFMCSTRSSVIINMFSEGVFCSFLASLAKASLCSVAYILNAFFIYQGIFSAGLKLYGATRTLHGLGISGLMWEKLAWCSRDSVPIVASAFSISLLFFAYLILLVAEGELFAFMTTFGIQMFLLVWAGLCIAYLRFFKAIKLQQPHTHITRDDEDYPYKSLFQPWTARFGLLWCICMMLLMTVERQVAAKNWTAYNYVAGFLPFGIFGIAYVGYKWYYRTVPVRYSDIGLASAKRQMDSQEWEEDRVYSEGFREKLQRNFHRWMA